MFLLFFVSLAKLSSSCALAFFIPFLHIQAAPLCSSQAICPWFHCLCISFSCFNLTKMSLLSHADVLHSLPDCLHMGIESSCAPRKMCLKSRQLSSASSSLRAVSLEVPSCNSLNNWKFTLLKFKVLALLFTWPVALEIVNSSRAWSLRPRLPPILTSPISSSGLVMLLFWLGHLSPGLSSYPWCTKSPGLLAACRAAFPADVRVTEVLQLDQSLRAWCFLQLK